MQTGQITMKIEFGYGKEIQAVEVPDENLVDVLVSNPVEHERRGADAVKYALENPIGTARLRDIVAAKAAGFSGESRDAGFSGESKAASGGAGSPADEGTGRRPQVVIVTSDISRPLPSYDVLPSVLDELYEAGCRPEDITVIIALGSHRSNTEEEHRRLVGDRCFSEVRVVDSSRDDLIHLGTTGRGTPVDYDRRVVEADIRICLGNIEFHYFAGYSGGCKAIMPGVSTPAAIQMNHRMMISEDSRTGKLEGNPVREDLEEACAMLGVDFIVNCVLDEHKKIVYAVAGDVVKAHRAGCKYLDKMYRKTVAEPADIILVSQGGSPKDANLYQTQKALDNSKHIIKEGGTIILIGACNEGLGNATFEKWLKEADAPQDLIDRIHADFKLGGHKAAAIAMVMQKAEVYLVSEMDPEFVRSIFFIPASTAQAAFDAAMKKHGPDARVIAMPFGGAVLPSLAK